MGFSQGGYCAAILALHHPSVFGTAIPISGFFRAGEGNRTAGIVFGGNAALIKADSPIYVAPQLPPAERANHYFIVVASPTQPFYGPESTGFVRLITGLGYPCTVLTSKVPHGWVQVRQQEPAILETWAARLVATGVL
jgi:hypothetical protein